MKKHTVSVFFLGTFMFCVGCGGDYYVEKTYWHVNRKHGETVRTPSGATEKEFQETIHALKRIVFTYPAQEKSAQIQFHIGEMYIARKDFSNAKKELMEVVMNFPEKQEFCVHAQFLIVSLFEKEGKWNEALEALDLLARKYPNHPQAATTLFEAAQIYEEKLKEPSKAYDLYAKLIKNYPNHKHGFMARTKISKKNAIESN